MENTTMNPMSFGYAFTPSLDCATAPITPWQSSAQGVAVRDAAADIVKPADAIVGGMAVARDRATAAATGHFDVAGTRPGIPAWSPPL